MRSLVTLSIDEKSRQIIQALLFAGHEIVVWRLISFHHGLPMMIPTSQRDWRLLAAGSGGLLLLAAGITLHSHWSDFLQWCLATQITLHRYLVMYLLLLNNHQYSGGVWLLVGAFSTACCTLSDRATASLSSPLT
jgi:hypothetical protein